METLNARPREGCWRQAIIYFRRGLELDIIHTNKNSPDELDDFYWCQITDVFQTLRAEEIDKYKLNGLVEVFNLSKELVNQS